MASFIDWKTIKTIKDLSKLNQELLFDESEIRDPVDMRHLNPNLTEDEVEDAMFWKRFVNGIIIVTGDTGSGKGVTLHMIAKKLEYYFHKTPILDTRPRKSFGEYVPFSKEFLAEQIERMKLFEAGKGEMDNDGRWFVWVEDEEHNKFRVEIMLRNTTLGLDEYGAKWMPRGQSNLAISIDLLKLYDFKRHLQCLTIGCGVDENDFNRKALKKTNWQIQCKFVDDAIELEDDPNALIFGATVRPVSYDEYNDVLVKGNPLAKLRINAKKPQHMLNGLAWKDIYNTQNTQGFDSATAKQLRRTQ